MNELERLIASFVVQPKKVLHPWFEVLLIDLFRSEYGMHILHEISLNPSESACFLTLYSLKKHGCNPLQLLKKLEENKFNDIFSSSTCFSCFDIFSKLFSNSFYLTSLKKTTICNWYHDKLLLPSLFELFDKSLQTLLRQSSHALLCKHLFLFQERILANNKYFDSSLAKLVMASPLKSIYIPYLFPNSHELAVELVLSTISSSACDIDWKSCLSSTTLKVFGNSNPKVIQVLLEKISFCLSNLSRKQYDIFAKNPAVWSCFTPTELTPSLLANTHEDAYCSQVAYVEKCFSTFSTTSPTFPNKHILQVIKYAARHPKLVFDLYILLTTTKVDNKPLFDFLRVKQTFAKNVLFNSSLTFLESNKFFYDDIAIQYYFKWNTSFKVFSNSVIFEYQTEEHSYAPFYRLIDTYTNLKVFANLFNARFYLEELKQADASNESFERDIEIQDRKQQLDQQFAEEFARLGNNVEEIKAKATGDLHQIEVHRDKLFFKFENKLDFWGDMLGNHLNLFLQKSSGKGKKRKLDMI
jgi:hypothetical protein